MENYTGSTSDHDGSEASYDMGATAGIHTGPDGYDGVGAGATMIVSAGSTAEVVQGKYGNAGVGVTAQAGYAFHGSDHVSDHGAGASVGGFVGDSATVSVDGDVKYAGVNAHVSDGASVGDDVGASASANVNFGHSKITVEAGGKIACLVGVHGKVKISIDTKPIEEDYDTTVHTVSEGWDDVKSVF